MHIDHSKLVELLADALGQEPDSVEERLSKLIDEIKEAISEGDAYEVDGFGVFSGFGNNIIFIPNDDLATEINYKYAGMEPIEMDEASAGEPEEPDEQEEEISEPVAEEDPFSGLLGNPDEEEQDDELTPAFELDTADATNEDAPDEDTIESDEFEDPFEIAGMDFREEAEDEQELSAEDPEDDTPPKPGPDKWGIDTYKDDTAERTFSGLLGEQEPMNENDTEEEEENPFDSLFEETEEESEDSDDLASALSKQLSDDIDPEPVDDDLSSIFGDDDDEDLEEEENVAEVLQNDPQSDNEDHEAKDDPDPFESLAGEEDEEEEVIPNKTENKEKPKDEVVPVIKNISSEGAKKEVKEDKKSKESSKSTPPKTKDLTPAQSPPVMLWILLIIIVLAGGSYGLGYFGIIDIPGVTPQSQVASTPAASQPKQSQPQENPTPAQEQQQAPAQEPESSVAEQPSEPEVTQPQQSPSGQPTYGLMGQPVDAANNGYTIVVFSLSSESSARAKQQELAQAGYRSLLASVASQQYGQLWRVSLGQFESLRSAALAAENLESPYSENYFITKIQ